MVAILTAEACDSRTNSILQLGCMSQDSKVEEVYSNATKGKEKHCCKANQTQ